MTIPLGQCFPWAWRYAVDAGRELHHGVLTDPWDKKTFWHAWVEQDGVVRDWQTSVGVWPTRSVEDFRRIWSPTEEIVYDDPAVRPRLAAGPVRTRNGNQRFQEPATLESDVSVMSDLERQARHFAIAGSPWFVRPEANPKRLPPALRGDDDIELERPTVEHYWTGEKILVRRVRPQHNGYVIYRGPSMFDGKPIVCIATGFVNPSDNEKTGPMIQTWIMREDIDPQEAVWTGEDGSICGDCVHRGEIVYGSDRPYVERRCVESVVTPGVVFREGGRLAKRPQVMPKSHGRSCYVVVSQRPLSVWKDYHRGSYPFAPVSSLATLFQGAYPVRIGSYGDPVAVPLEVWRAVLTYQVCWTGYTHQWQRDDAQGYRDFLMASVDDPRELAEAQALGWRTFRIGRKNEPLIAGVEIICPATPEGGSRTQCDSCNLCMGTAKGAKSIVTAPHGMGARHHEERGEQSRRNVGRRFRPRR